jgi:transposase
MATPLPFDLVIGLDRSDTKADLHLIDTHTGQRSSLTLSTLPERLHDWLAQVRTQYPTGRVALCLEQPAGNLIVFLETYAWITLYAINPSTLQHFRDAFVTSRAKDDTQDARYLAELTLAHHDKLPVWTPEDSQTRRLQHSVLHRRAVVDERTELTNRLEALLKAYFPQALELCGEELWRPLATEFLLQWPTLQSVQKAKPAALKEFYYKQGSRSQTLVQQRVERIAKAIALTDEAAVLDTYTRRVQLICRQLQLVVAAIKDYDRETAELFVQHPDRAIFSQLPGAGPALAPRLLASMGSQRERFPTAASLQRYTGIAPVTKQSGGKRHVHRRYCCPKFHRQSFHEFAGSSILFSRWAAAYYAIHREETGCGHHTAVRALAYKWQRIIWRCWQKREAYDDARYEKALLKQGSRVAARLDKIEVGKNPHKAKA